MDPKCLDAIKYCGSCQKAGVACKYVDRTKSHQQLLEGLQRRLKQVEATNRSVAARITAHASPAVQNDNDDSGNRGGSEMAGPNVDLVEGVGERDQPGGEPHFLGSASGVFLASMISTGMARRARGYIKGARGKAQLEHDHRCYPFLHRETTLLALDQVYQDPSYIEHDAFASFVFDMILAIPTASVRKFNMEALADAETYQVRAMQRLNEVMRNGGIQALQALLLLCQYKVTNSFQDTSASKLCFELRLQREQTYRPIQGVPATVQASRVAISREIRRWCFWCCVAMDRIISITLGRPLAIQLRDVDVHLPNTSHDNPFPSSFCRTALFAHIVRYHIICGDILSTLHIASPRPPNDTAATLAARDKLSNILAQWRHDTAGLSLRNRLGESLLGDQPSFRSREWHELLYHNTLLILSHRFSHIHQSRRVNYTWITPQFCFYGWSTLHICLGSSFPISQAPCLRV
ncbi:fungal specific transcription factor domain-containing protein [Aspergillus alliaceus]|uniref:fungal specific transcription factor domain-containing protein n=1 Tax=Petromyces alliaceus TaxID=209559 RepID=UPI0012A45B63|nr:fungal-specific transcription factor domain-containing protein [Aspergillus alliaceus]KAB8234245.1 fungal-specific transcription factor domain-containing protein [Aspergillus alliaceus]